ncbi:28 kDa heat- and acid-stable phosphoprotein-like isoform X1 [Cylas formicarius]|uniref:28 kDa heat- and acid-stable phosphoprotein-like isoform X1 n=1 Tax=Cylas formicarius TaxID=197179 RepID=UPI002958B2D2|nr:28 kDa heat- and acid-stable phosphoprotein-like isoform X1 [Cylas formicarius]
MPRGKFTNHKGRNRRFTNPEELEEERRRDEEKNWRKQQGGSSSEESEQEKDDKSSSGDSDSEESSEEDTGKAKGVSNLIEIENPNRVQKKVKKVSTLKTDELHKPQLSRREREEIEKQKAHAHYQKLHAEGKTDQARADLARLAIIRQQREEAKKRREAEQKEKEDAVKAKTAQTQKALGKK